VSRIGPKKLAHHTVSVYGRKGVVSMSVYWQEEQQSDFHIYVAQYLGNQKILSGEVAFTLSTPYILI